jgi:hypothetical protein
MMPLSCAAALWARESLLQRGFLCLKRSLAVSARRGDTKFSHFGYLDKYGIACRIKSNGCRIIVIYIIQRFVLME